MIITDDQGERIDLKEGSRRQRRLRNLICVLALHGGPLSPHRLKTLLWDPDERDYTSALTTLVYKARAVLPQNRLVTEAVPSGGQHYHLLRLPGDEIDVDRFHDAVDFGLQARKAGQPQRAIESFQDALALWRAQPGDPLLPDFPDALAMRQHRESLLARRRAVTEQLGEVHLELGRHGPELAEQIRTWLMFDPDNEYLYQLLMVNWYRAGRKGQAMQAFQEASHVLDELIKTGPGPALNRIRDRIRNDDPTLAWQP
ncbi:AfsR/SARP family transcriptional regulator [Actinomadura vinacea]|uniref:AfsR/SARP family transcriptional regulator n=1 Tax=Actinomadura vinacea TaxID=115336 RepID=UPI0031D4D505